MGNSYIAALLILAATVHGETLVVDPLATNLSSNTAKMVRIVAPRGGFGSGQIVTSSPVTPTELRGPGGSLKLRVRYRQGDALHDTLPAGERAQSVWLTAEAPATAAPGKYTGQVAGVPVELTVPAFTMPAAKDRQLIVSTLQSADTVALQYGVAPYSARHFELLEASLALQGRLGNNVLYVPVIGRTYFGNQTGLIQFRGDKPDFKAFEQYLALYVKHCGPPRIVVVYLWDKYLSEKDERSGDKTTLAVSALDAAGKITPTTVPAYPANPAMWKAVLDGVAQRVGGATLLIGQSCDTHPNAETAAMFQQIAPGVKWLAWTHGYGYSGWRGGGGQEVGMFESPDFTPGNDKVRGGWNETTYRLNSLRCWVGMNSEPLRWRIAPDLSCGRHKQGVCRGYGKIGLDYWPLPAEPGKKGPRTLWAGPYPGLSYCRLDRGQPHSLTVPGPKGALATVRLEMLAEGAQEAEARIAVERAGKAKNSDVLTARYDMVIGAGKREETQLDPRWTDELLALYELAGQTK